MCRLKVKLLVDAEVELDNGVGRGARHLSHQRHQRLEAVKALALVHEDEGRHVAQQVRAHRLQRVAVVGLGQEELNQLLRALRR